MLEAEKCNGMDILFTGSLEYAEWKVFSDRETAKTRFVVIKKLLTGQEVNKSMAKRGKRIEYQDIQRTKWLGEFWVMDLEVLLS